MKGGRGHHDGDLIGSALAPPSSSSAGGGGGDDHADVEGGSRHQLLLQHESSSRPAAGSSSQEAAGAQHTQQPRQHAPRDAASTFFSEASGSDHDGWGEPYYTTTEDDSTLRGIDVDISQRYRSPNRPGPATPSTLGGGQSPTLVFSPAMSSPGNTSLSSTNLSPHQQKRYGGSGSGGGGTSSHRRQLHPPAPPDIMTQSGAPLGANMMVPTLGVPVAGAQPQQQRPVHVSLGKQPTTKDISTSLQNGRGGGSSRPAGSSGIPPSGTGIILPNYGDMAAAATMQGASSNSKGHRRKRSWSGGGKGKNAAPVHRRTRSGDGKAAGLLTGGAGDWKGMELDQLPLPQPIRWANSATSAAAEHKHQQKQTSGGRVGSAPSLAVAAASAGSGDGGKNDTDLGTQKLIITSPRKAAAADARRILEARYGTALMGRSESRQSIGYSETDESEIETGGPPLHDGQRRSPTRAASTSVSSAGGGMARPFSPASNADLSETTQESNHSLFSWISGQFSTVSGRSKSGLAKLRSGQSNRSSSSRTFGSSLGMSGVGEAASFSPTNNNDMLTRELNRSSSLQQQLGENAPLLEREPSATSNRSSSDRASTSDGDSGGDSSPFEDQKNDLFRQRKVMIQISANAAERESPDLDKTQRSFKSILSQPSFGVPDHEADKFPTFVCPNCRTRQRNFFTVSSAPRQFESPAGFLAFYMALYVVSSLFIFGLEEGWPALDCVYFAVITLTTAGLGDYVPSTDSAKIICSVFIYFGVACIGLLLGSLLASGLDDASRKRARETMVNDCPNCARLEAQKRMLDVSRRSYVPSSFGGAPSEHKTWYSERSNVDPILHHKQVSPTVPVSARKSSGKPPSGKATRFDIPVVNSPGGPPHPLLQSPQPTHAGENTPLGYNQTAWGGQTYNATYTMSPFSTGNGAAAAQTPVLSSQYGGAQTISPVPRNVTNLQSHTRHMSFDIQNMANTPAPPFGPSRSRNYSVDVQATPGLPSNDTFMSQTLNTTMATPDGTEYAQVGREAGDDEDDYSDSYSTSSEASSGRSPEESYESSASEYDSMVPLSKVQSAKYVFLTLRQALANSVFIIAIGGFGFYFIERMTVVNAFYFTTVLLTTVG